MKILILTPIAIEYNEVRKHLASSSIVQIQQNGVNYEKGSFHGLHHNFEVIIKQTGSKNSNIALVTEKAIQYFKPEIVILTGIAGGVKDVNIGDLVVANKLYGYESGKEIEEKFVSRPEVINCSADLFSLAENIGRDNEWKDRSSFAKKNHVFYGPIASGDKLIASKKSIVYQRLKTHYNDTLALEMEAIGFGSVMLHYPIIKFINIRGISDLLNNKSTTDKNGSQKVAVSNVSAFVFELLHQLDYSKLNIPNMDIKSISENVFYLLFPFLKKNKSIKKISSDITEATDTSISAIWNKIKPIFIEEFEEEKDILNEEAKEKGAVIHVMKKALKKDELLKKELNKILEEQASIIGKGSVKIVNSKNVISGSEIRVGGDFKLGDEY